MNCHLADAGGPCHVLLGRYQLLERIGEGGMGVVWRGFDLDLEEPVAIKFLREDIASDTTLRAWFRREVRLARRVTHPNVARVFEFGRDGQRDFLTMEYVAGESLQAVFDRGVPLPSEQLRQLAIGLCRGLAAAHAASVVHGDLKPGNILLAPGRGAVLTDFGIAQLVADGHASADGSVGTPMYMAPELLVGEPVSARSDVYAVGVVLFEALTARLPWPEGGILTLLDDKCGGGAPDLTALAEPHLRPWAELIDDCLQARPERRPADAQALLERLQALPGRVVAPGDSGRWLRVAGLTDAEAGVGEPASSDDELIDALTLVPSPLEGPTDARPVAPLRFFDDERAPRDPAMDPATAALYSEAQAAFTAMRPDAAMRLFAAALARAPTYSPLQFGHTMARIKQAVLADVLTQDELAELRRLAVEGVLARPDAAEAHAVMMGVLYVAGETVPAAQAAMQTLRRAPSQPQALGLVADLLIEVGRLADAERRLDGALAADRDSGYMWIVRSHLAAARGRWDEYYAIVGGPLRELRYCTAGQVRRMMWHPDPDVLTRFERDLEAGVYLLPPPLLALTRRVLTFARVPERRHEVFAGLVADELRPGVSWRDRFLAQMLCEMACALDEPERALALLAAADAQNLCDQQWLERCPLLEPLRGDPRFAGFRVRVRARAEVLADVLTT